MNEPTLCVDGWEFSRDQGTTWAQVDLPHDWLIEDTRDLYASGEGWYRRTLPVQPNELDLAWTLRFEGVYMDSTVLVNGRPVGANANGYTTFEIELTGRLHSGDNLVEVRANHLTPNSRWYPGAGIYRNVWLYRRNPAHLVTDGVYLVARWGSTGGTVEVTAEVTPGTVDWSLRHTVWGPQGDRLMEGDGPRLNLGAVQVWSTESPVLYTLTTELLVDGSVVDQQSRRFGFRTVELDPGTGLKLNGQPLKLHGVCLHHDLGCLGAAMNRAALKRQFKLLKSMGVNALRSAHNVPAVEFMDLADEMGFLVVTELYDMWEKPKTQFDFARFFGRWAERDVASWVRRDRNHPCLLMWGIGNEIYDCHAGPRGEELTLWLSELVRLHDPHTNGRVTLGSNYMPWEGAQRCADIVKVAGYNYGEKLYQDHHARHPDWVIYGSETSSIVQSRGIYHFPARQSVLADDDLQCSSLGNSSTSWGARSVEACIVSDRDTEFSLGQFVWSGIDYIGEPTPYHTKNSYFGQIDTAGFTKDSFFIYQAAWTDYRTAPMVHLFPYWDFNPGQSIDVRVCSNAPVVELFFNGESQGTFAIDHQRGRQLVGAWTLTYRPGVLEAVAYDGAGREVARDRAASFGDPAHLILTPDKANLDADGADLIFVEISASDDRGNSVANANNRVEVTVTGAGRLVGLDNGDSADFDQYKGTSRRLFSGKLLAVVAAKTSPGTIEVEVASPGLPTASLSLSARPAPVVTRACITENRRSVVPREVPIRKVEILAPQGTALSPGKETVTVVAALLPANATYQDLRWRVTNDAGIDSNLATLEVLGTTARVTARGDGAFRVRCTTNNGGHAAQLISQLEFNATGLGPAYLDPYNFISGGLYTRSKGELGNGNERGVATPREGESWVCFDNIDFGDYGSDLITLPVFALDSEPFPVEIWEGEPGDTGVKLAQVTYQRPSIWNTYQAETYRLSCRLKGITSVAFVFHRKVHLKGFSFARVEKAFQQLAAGECDTVYGDSFTRVGDAIEAIGNNVSLEFRTMDFGQKGARRLVVCGRSSLERSTLHLRFDGPGATNQVAEFGGSSDWTEQSFALEPVFGPQNFTLVFLPGSQFDLRWLRFE